LPGTLCKPSSSDIGDLGDIAAGRRRPSRNQAGRRLVAVGFPTVGRLRDEVQARAAEIKSVVRKHRGMTVALFGSVARGDERPDSDIDLLVEFAEGASLFDLLHASDELESLLGRPVDVVSIGGLKERDRHILEESVPL
jgi:predicted nucleotidyltransferase